MTILEGRIPRAGRSSPSSAAVKGRYWRDRYQDLGAAVPALLLSKVGIGGTDTKI